MFPAILPSFIIFTIALAVLPYPERKLLYILLTIKPIVISLMILGTLINSSKALTFILELPILRLIGRISYSLYLWQQLFLVWDQHRIQSFGILQSFPLNIVAAFACATLSLLFVEKYLIALGHRIAPRQTAHIGVHYRRVTSVNIQQTASIFIPWILRMSEETASVLS